VNVGDKVKIKNLHPYNGGDTFSGQHGVIERINGLSYGIRIINPIRGLNNVYYFANGEFTVINRPTYVYEVTKQLGKLGNGDIVRASITDSNGKSGTVEGYLYASPGDSVTLVGITIKDRGAEYTSKHVSGLELIKKVGPVEPPVGSVIRAKNRRWIRVDSNDLEHYHWYSQDEEYACFIELSTAKDYMVIA